MQCLYARNKNDIHDHGFIDNSYRRRESRTFRQKNKLSYYSRLIRKKCSIFEISNNESINFARKKLDDLENNFSDHLSKHHNSSSRHDFRLKKYLKTRTTRIITKTIRKTFYFLRRRSSSIYSIFVNRIFIDFYNLCVHDFYRFIYFLRTKSSLIFSILRL
jgi:hypothetical protein